MVFIENLFFLLEDKMLYQILPKYDYQFSADSMKMFFKTLSVSAKKQSFKNKLHEFIDFKKILDFCFIIDCKKVEKVDRISFFFRINHPDQEEMVVNSLRILFQNHADIFSVEELENYTTVHTLYVQKPVNTSTDKNNVGSSLATFKDDQIFLYILGAMQNNTRITIDFSIKRSKAPVQKSLLRIINTDIDADVLIRVSGKTKYQRNIIKAISNNIANLTAGEVCLHIDYRNSYKFSTVTGSELLNLIQIPSFFHKTENETLKRVYKLEMGQRTLDTTEFASGIKFGKVCHPMQDRDVRISETQLRKHLFITGQTGSGKSSAIEEMTKDILFKKVTGQKNVPGLSFFDPAETSALGIIDMILKLRADGHNVAELVKHMHYVDFGYDDCIFPISILNKGMPATEIIDFFKMLYGDQQAIQVDRNMTSAVNALLLDNLEHNVADIPKVFQDETFRERLIQVLAGNPYNEDSVKFLKGKFNPTQVDPILNRTDPFLNTPKKKLMFGLNSTVDGLKNLKKWMDDGDIILYNLKGLNDFDRKIIIGYIGLKYYTVGLTREENALLHIMSIDEAHKVQIPIFQKMLAELRKNGVSLCPMTQFLDQYDDNYLQALLGNVGTKISFRQGDDAARRLANNLPGNVDRDALKRLPDRLGYISTEDEKEMKSILVEVQPPYRYTEGKVIPYPDTSNGQIVTRMNIEKNRNFAKDLMKRDFLLKKDAEQLLFHKQYSVEESLQVEEELLEEGDALWDQ